MAETALIGVDIDLSLVNRRLAEAGELTAKEARHMQRELTDAFKRSARASEDAARQMARAQSKAARDAEREAKRAAREIERSFNEQASSVRGLFSAALGGIGGDILDLTDTLGGMSKGLMLAGGALATIAIAPEVIRNMHEFAAGAQETADALGRVMTPDEERRAKAYETAVSQASVAVNELKLDAQLLVGEALVPLADAARDTVTVLRMITESGAVVYFADLTAAVGQSKDEFIEALGPFGDFATVVARLPFLIGDLITSMAEGAADFQPMTAAALGLSSALDGVAESAQKTGRVYVDFSESAATVFERADEEAKKYAETMEAEAVAAIEEGARAQREYEEAVRNASAAMMEMGEDIDTSLTVAELGRVQEAAREAAHAIAGISGDDDEQGDPFERFIETLEDVGKALTFVDSQLDPVLNNIGTLTRMQQQQHEDRAQQLRDEARQSRATYQSALREYEASREGMTAVEQAAQEDYLRRLNLSEKAKREQVNAMRREEVNAAMKAFNATKALQIAQASIDAARNAVVLTGHLAFMKFAAPFVAGGIAAAQLATSLAIIKNTPPPTFHFGTSAAGASMPGGAGPIGIPGAEVPAVLEQGEGVISRRGMATPGMAELVEAVNAGRAPTGRSMVTDIEADLLAQRLNRPYAPAIRGRALAGTNTFYRGR